MAKKDQEAKARIIKVATGLLLESPDAIDKITVRQIAEQAGAGIGSINYYFGSRDKLLSIAIGNILAETANQYIDQKDTSGLEPVVRLKNMLKELCNISLANEKLIQFTLMQGVMNGDVSTPLYLVPMLKDIFGVEKDEIELRITALQLLQPLQMAGISPEAFRMYCGIDLYDATARGNLIDMLVDHLVYRGNGGMKDENCDYA